MNIRFIWDFTFTKIWKNRDYKETITACALLAHTHTQQNISKLQTTASLLIAWDRKTTNIYQKLINCKFDHDSKEMSPNCVKHKWNVVAALEHMTIMSDTEIPNSRVHYKQQRQSSR